MSSKYEVGDRVIYEVEVKNKKLAEKIFIGAPDKFITSGTVVEVMTNDHRFQSLNGEVNSKISHSYIINRSYVPENFIIGKF